MRSTLIATMDVHGEHLTIGARVRCHDFAFVDCDGVIRLMDMTGERVSYLEGTLTAIGDVAIDRCLRYTVDVDSRITSTPDGIGLVIETMSGIVYPPLNGTPITPKRVYCGVESTTHQPDRDTRH